MRRLALLALLASVGCHTSEPPEVYCPAPLDEPVSWCSLNQAPLIVEATVEPWAKEARVLDLEGFPDTVFTPAPLRVKRSLRGGASGRLDVLVSGCIGEDGSSIEGPLTSSGIFLIVPADGYAVLKPHGFFRWDGELLKNPGVAKDGITEAELLEQLRKVSELPTCAPVGSGS